VLAVNGVMTSSTVRLNVEIDSVYYYLRAARPSHGSHRSKSLSSIQSVVPLVLQPAKCFQNVRSPTVRITLVVMQPRSHRQAAWEPSVTRITVGSATTSVFWLMSVCSSGPCAYQLTQADVHTPRHHWQLCEPNPIGQYGRGESARRLEERRLVVRGDNGVPGDVADLHILVLRSISLRS